MTHAETQAILAALRGDMQRMIDTALRNQTGVVPGGPYSSFTVGQDGRVTWAGSGSSVFCHVSRSSTQSISSGSTTSVQWNNEVEDDSGLFDAGIDNTLITLTSTGLYLAFASVHWAGNTAGQRQFNLRGTGTSIRASYAAPSAIGSAGIVHGGGGLYRADSIGNEIWVEVFQNSGSSINLQSGAGFTDLQVIKLA